MLLPTSRESSRPQLGCRAQVAESAVGVVRHRKSHLNLLADQKVVPVLRPLRQPLNEDTSEGAPLEEFEECEFDRHVALDALACIEAVTPEPGGDQDRAHQGRFQCAVGSRHRSRLRCSTGHSSLESPHAAKE